MKTDYQPSRVPGLRVVLSVRLRDGGLPFRFEYAARTISRLAAECDAKKAANIADYLGAVGLDCRDHGFSR